MKVDSDTLMSIAKKLIELEKLDIQVTEFELNGNICVVESADSQLEGRTYYLKDVQPKRVVI